MSADRGDDPPGGGARAPAEIIVPPPTGNLPAVAAPPRPFPPPRRRRLSLLLLLVVPMVVAGGYWWLRSGPLVPPGFASGNGRLEADEIDIATKFAGRIAELRADEGDMVHAGEVVAVMDTRDLQASLDKAQAVVGQAQHALDEAKANLDQQQTQVKLAAQELERAAALVPKGFATAELLDQRRQQMNAALAVRSAAEARVNQAQQALIAARHDAELYRVNIADNSLVAPRDGRIEYRVANVGEVLGAGGKVFTMLDTGYVYMDIYLPTADAGRIRPGAEARIVLDAYPARPIPAKVVFIATQAQFTPKTVETRDEREKLMFRIRVRIDPDRLRPHAELVRSGLPGVAYVRTDPNAPWPPQLRGDAS